MNFISILVLCLLALSLNSCGSEGGSATTQSSIKVSASTVDGIYMKTDSISIQVTFDEVVTVTGTPSLILETGETDQKATYTSGSGSSELTFTYTVQSQDYSADLEYVSKDSLSAEDGSIKDSGGSDIALTLPDPGEAYSLSASKSIQVDARTKVSLGYGQTVCARGPAGSLKCWGDNADGQLGRGDTNDIGDGPNEMGSHLAAIDLGSGRAAIDVSVGLAHVCALLDNATVKCWGLNDEGQLGRGNTSNIGDGASEMGDNLAAIDLGSGRTAIQISAGKHFTCALLDNDSVKCWGSNTYGQLGQGNTANRGDGSSEMGDSLTAIDLGNGRSAVQISAGGNFVCALLDNATVKCWGLNDEGQLGQGNANNYGDGAGELGDSLSAVDLGSSRTVKKLSVGEKHVCVVLDNSSVKCWGENNAAQLGQTTGNLGDGAGEMGDNLPVVDLGSSRTASQIASGDSHTCAYLDSKELKCWGGGASGELGFPASYIGDGPNEMGDNLVSADLDGTLISVSAGLNITCGVLTSGAVKCFGLNDEGQLGQGDTDQRGDDPDEMGSHLPAIDLGTDF